MEVYANIEKITRSHNDERSFRKLLDPDGDPDHPQNRRISALRGCEYFLTVLSIYIYNFESSFTNRQTDKNIISLIGKINDNHI